MWLQDWGHGGMSESVATVTSAWTCLFVGLVSLYLYFYVYKDNNGVHHEEKGTSRSQAQARRHKLNRSGAGGETEAEETGSVNHATSLHEVCGADDVHSSPEEPASVFSARAASITAVRRAYSNGTIMADLNPNASLVPHDQSIIDLTDDDDEDTLRYLTETCPLHSVEELLSYGTRRMAHLPKDFTEPFRDRYADTSPRARGIPKPSSDRKHSAAVRRKLIVCHDMRGNYLGDRFHQGHALDGNAYQVYCWSIIDTFIYFSHHMVTIPPRQWINVAHRHGTRYCIMNGHWSYPVIVTELMCCCVC
jgi:Glycosyl hydrolase family 85